MYKIFKALYFIGFLFQFITIAAMLTLASIPGYFFLESIWQTEQPIQSLFYLFLVALLSLTLFMFVCVAFVRVINLILPIKQGRSSVYGTQMMVWAVQYMLMNFMNTWFLPVFRTTPLMNLFYRFMGAKIGNNVFFNSSFIYEPQFLEIGDNSRVGENAIVVPHTTEGKEFICKKIKIGKNVTIGQYAQILPGAVIGDNVIIAAGAIVPKDKVIQDKTIYGGNPIQLLKNVA